MKVYHDFDEKSLFEVAEATGVKQCVADVSYARRKFHWKERLYIIRNEYCFLLGEWQREKMRIIGIAVIKEMQGFGIGSKLLAKAIQDARAGGAKVVHTKSLSGVQFYARKGFDIVGMKGGNYLLQKVL